jgi:hypothetical protein
MKLGLVLIAGLIPGQVVGAARLSTVPMEVNFLLGAIERSGCEFQRNGSWYDAKSAQRHLRDKYQFLASGNHIKSTEDFIESVASNSSVTGEPYEIRCGKVTTTSREWLLKALERLRAF